MVGFLLLTFSATDDFLTQKMKNNRKEFNVDSRSAHEMSDNDI